MTTRLARRSNGSSLEMRDPLSELNRLVSEIDTVLDRAFTSLGRPQLSSLFEGAFTPLADIEETDDAYVVGIELPGVRRDDVSVEAAGRQLSVSGERKEREQVGILRRRAAHPHQLRR